MRRHTEFRGLKSRASRLPLDLGMFANSAPDPDRRCSGWDLIQTAPLRALSASRPDSAPMLLKPSFERASRLAGGDACWTRPGFHRVSRPHVESRPGAGAMRPRPLLGRLAP